MKIVETDNYGTGTPQEQFLNLGEMPEEAAEEIAEVINKHLCGDRAPRVWKVVGDGYRLAEGTGRRWVR